MFKVCIVGLSLLGLVQPLTAQDKKDSGWGIRPDLTIYATVAEPSLSKVTHRTLGWGGSVALVTHLAGGDNPVRFGYAGNVFNGSQYGTIRSSLNNQQIFVDVFFQTPLKDTMWFLGASLNRYHVKNEGQETYRDGSMSNYKEAVYVWALPEKAINGKYRGGLRAGLSYRITRHLAAEYTFQVTEAATKQSGWDTMDENWNIWGSEGNINPSWSQVALRYTF